jgi:hypothetical protein
MNILNRVIGVLMLLCILCSFGALVLGHTQSTPMTRLLAAMRTTPDGAVCPSPCAFGLMPGITPFYDSEKLIAAHPALHVLNLVSQNVQARFPYLIVHLKENLSLIVYGDADGTVVTEVALVIQPPAVLLRDALAVFASPRLAAHFANFSIHNYWINLGYPSGQIIIQGNLGYLEPLKASMPVSDIVVIHESGSMLYQASRWRGFAPYPVIAVGP